MKKEYEEIAATGSEWILVRTVMEVFLGGLKLIYLLFVGMVLLIWEKDKLERFEINLEGILFSHFLMKAI